eukprot:scaffold46870_cov79-Phaeocystis_antarctica.AAC.1
MPLDLAEPERRRDIDLRRLGSGCGRRLVTGSRVIRETIHTGLGCAFLYLWRARRSAPRR